MSKPLTKAQIQANLKIKIPLWQKDPLLFIKDMWNLTPQPVKPQYQTAVKILIEQHQLQSIRYEWFEPFQRGLHITWQQWLIFLCVKAAIDDTQSKRISISSAHGIGKAHPNDLEIDTPTGIKKIKDLKIGDEIFSEKGTTHISSVMPQGKLPVFKIIFDDGSYSYCTENHSWKVKGYSERRRNKPFINLSLNEMFKRGLKRSNGKGLARQFNIPIIEAVEYKKQKTIIDPYTLGTWLGDGTRLRPQITNFDKEVIDRIKNKYKLSTFNKENYTIHDIRRHLKDLDLFDKYSYEKEIPLIYKYNSIETRYELLRGLLDADGTVNKAGSVIFSSTSIKLINDTVWIVRSLGGKASIQKTIKKPFYYKDKKKVFGRDCYNVTINFKENTKLFYIKRKQERLKKTTQERYLTRWIDRVEPYKIEECTCIEVEEGDGIYLVNNFIPTHNSCSISLLLIWHLFCHHLAQIAVTAPTSQQLHDVLWKEISIWITRLPGYFQQYFDWQSSYIRMKQQPNEWFASARTARKDSTEALAGVHGPAVMVIADEASGVVDEVFNTMEGSLTEQNIFVILISNPTRLAGYFWETHKKPSVADKWQHLQFDNITSPVVKDDYAQGIIDRHGKNSDEYRIRVLGKFPNEADVDDKGYAPILGASEIKEIEKPTKIQWIGEPIMGIDPAGEGRDKSVWVIRDQFKAAVVMEQKTSNELQIAQITRTLALQHKVRPERIAIDSFGIGSNTAAELAKEWFKIKPINVGDRPKKDSNEAKIYLNLRAQYFMALRKSIRSGFELIRNKAWIYEIPTIKYCRNATGKIQIMAKKDIRKESGKSPDYADALSLTFFIKSTQGIFRATSRSQRSQLHNQQDLPPSMDTSLRPTQIPRHKSQNNIYSAI